MSTRLGLQEIAVTVLLLGSCNGQAEWPVERAHAQAAREATAAPPPATPAPAPSTAPESQLREELAACKRQVVDLQQDVRIGGEVCDRIVKDLVQDLIKADEATIHAREEAFQARKNCR